MSQTSSEIDFKAIWAALEQKKLPKIKRVFERNPQALAIQTPFGNWVHYAAGKLSIEVIEFFIDKGVDPFALHPRTGGNAIDEAAKGGSVEAVRYFLKLGLSCDVSDPVCNPLFSAILSRSKDIVELLLSAGIDVTARYSGENMMNMDAVAFAMERGEIEIANLIALHIAEGDEEIAAKLVREGDEIAELNNK